MPRRPLDLDALRRHAVARSLFTPTTLPRALQRLGFVQADPIRAPARAQDLTLRHRVRDYRAGDLERRYPRLGVEEDALVNYGFVSRELLPLMHPRTAKRPWDAKTQARADEVLAFVRGRRETHPRDVQAAFDHGRVASWFGGSLSASTHLLDGMHYRGMLRVVRREAGTRVYAAIDHPPVDDSPDARLERARALLMLVVRKYAPLPSASLGYLGTLLGYGAPQLRAEVKRAVAEFRRELPQAALDGTTWLWVPGEDPAAARWRVDDDRVRLLAPFDPVVWDRRRFELLWGWAYRFEAYTPAHLRTMGHYALPLLWGDRVVGWATAAREEARDGTPTLSAEVGLVDRAVGRDPAWKAAVAADLAQLAAFIGAPEGTDVRWRLRR